jgi:hypothetical protein
VNNGNPWSYRTPFVPYASDGHTVQIYIRILAPVNGTWQDISQKGPDPVVSAYGDDSEPEGD